MAQTFFFYDLETSGLNPRQDRIMQFMDDYLAHNRDNHVPHRRSPLKKVFKKSAAETKLTE